MQKMNNITCTICRDNLFSRINEGSISSTHCGHVYHYQCIIQWIERSKTCPQCRTDLTDHNTFKLNLHVDEAAPSQEDSKKMKIAELKNRVKQLAMSESDLIKQLNRKLQYLERTNGSLNVACEELRKNNIELEDRVRELSNTVTRKHVQFRELEEDCTNAVATAMQVNEELRAKNTELESRVYSLLEVEVVLRNDLEIRNNILQETEENCATANMINDDLRNKNMELENRVKQHLKVVLDFENTLAENRIAIREVKENDAEANSFDGESRRRRSTQNQRAKVQNWLQNDFIYSEDYDLK